MTRYFYKWNKWNVDIYYYGSVLRHSFKVKGTMEEKIIFLKCSSLHTEDLHLGGALPLSLVICFRALSACFSRTLYVRGCFGVAMWLCMAMVLMHSALRGCSRDIEGECEHTKFFI